MLQTARIILAVVCGSYLLSAMLLGIARSRGEPIAVWMIAGWAVLGLISFALLPAIAPGRWIVLGAMLLTLGPWMAYSLVQDAKGSHWIIAGTDIAGLAAIGYSIWIIR